MVTFSIFQAQYEFLYNALADSFKGTTSTETADHDDDIYMNEADHNVDIYMNEPQRQ